MYDQATALLRALYDCRSEEAFIFANELLKLLYPLSDDAYYQELCVFYDFRARAALANGQYDKAMDHLGLCSEYAMKAEGYLKEHQIKPDTITPCPNHPLFARRTFDHELYLQDNPHEMVYCFATAPTMKVLFERADHQALVKELQKRINAFDPFNEKN